MNALYTYQGDEGVYLSVVEIADEDLAAVAATARSAPEVQAILSGKTHLLNYVVPTEMYIAEIPMYLPLGEAFGHSVPSDRNPALYKVIFTEAVFGGEGLPAGGDILWNAVNKIPLVEAHVDLRGKAAVTRPCRRRQSHSTATDRCRFSDDGASSALAGSATRRAMLAGRYRASLDLGRCSHRDGERFR